MSIKWRRRGKTLEDGGKYKVVDESLTIKNVSSDDCGEYYCVARDGHSIITSVGILTIKDGKFICFIILYFAFLRLFVHYWWESDCSDGVVRNSRLRLACLDHEEVLQL
jgi:hypothetical protein